MTREELRTEFERIICEVIDRKDHWCIAYSEVQPCCIDPRYVGTDGYGGEAIAAGLLDLLVDAARGSTR